MILQVRTLPLATKGAVNVIQCFNLTSNNTIIDRRCSKHKEKTKLFYHLGSNKLFLDNSRFL